MISCQTLSLKKSYKVLQKNMWEISAQASQLKKENGVLKGKVNTKRMMMSANMNMRRKKCERIQEKDQEWVQDRKSAMQLNLEREIKINKKVKDEIENMEKQKKEMEVQIQNINKIEKQNKRKFKQLQKNTKKYNQLLKCQAQAQQILANNDRKDLSYGTITCNKDQILRSVQVNGLLQSQANYIQEITTISQHLKEQQRKSKFLADEVLKLLQKKSLIKQQLKTSKISVK